MNGFVVKWTQKELDSLNDLEDVVIHPTRFVDIELLDKLGLSQDFGGILKMMGLKAFEKMDYPIYSKFTKEFLATVKVDFKKHGAKIAKEGTLTFKMGNKGYILSLYEVCEISKFSKKPLVKFPVFRDANTF